MFLLFAYLKKVCDSYIIEILMVACCLVAAVGAYAFYQNGYTLFGPTKGELKTQVQTQDKVILELQDTQKHNTELTKKQVDSSIATQAQLVDHFENKQTVDKAFENSLYRGQEAFKEASKPVKQPKVGNGSHLAPKVAPEAPMPPDQSYVLDDPQSVESLTLAKAQFAMVQEAYCLSTSCQPTSL